MLTRQLCGTATWLLMCGCLAGCGGERIGEDVVTSVVPPSARIAGLEPGAGEYFYNVVGAFLVGGGGIVLVDNAHRIQYFTTDGERVRTVGSSGEGPGESRSISKAAISSGDTLFTYDRATSVATFWSPQGDYVRSQRIRADILSRNILPLADGSIVTEIDTPGPAPVRGDVITRSSKVLVRTVNGSAAELTSYDGDEMLVIVGGGGIIAGGFELLHHTYLAVDGMQTVVGDGKTGDVAIFDVNGVEQLRFNAAERERAQLTARDVQQFIETLMIADRRLQNQERTVERGIAADRMLPAMSGILVDDMHRIWVEHVNYDRDADGVIEWDRAKMQRKFTVFSASGEPLHKVIFPAAFQPTHIAQGTVVGVQRSELGEQSVALYRVPAGIR